MLTLAFITFLVLDVLLALGLLSACRRLSDARKIIKDLNGFCDDQKRMYERMLDYRSENLKNTIDKKNSEINKIRIEFNHERQELVNKLRNAEEHFRASVEANKKLDASFQIQERQLRETLHVATQRLTRIDGIEEANRLCQIRIAELLETIGELRAHQVAYMAPPRKRKPAKKARNKK